MCSLPAVADLWAWFSSEFAPSNFCRLMGIGEESDKVCTVLAVHNLRASPSSYFALPSFWHPVLEELQGQTISLDFSYGFGDRGSDPILYFPIFGNPWWRVGSGEPPHPTPALIWIPRFGSDFALPHF